MCNERIMIQSYWKPMRQMWAILVCSSISEVRRKNMCDQGNVPAHRTRTSSKGWDYPYFQHIKTSFIITALLVIPFSTQVVPQVKNLVLPHSSISESPHHDPPSRLYFLPALKNDTIAAAKIAMTLKNMKAESAVFILHLDCSLFLSPS
jgi:hypothetical protein